MRKYFLHTIFIILSILFIENKIVATTTNIDFYGDTVKINIDESIKIPFNDSLSATSVQYFHDELLHSEFKSTINDLVNIQQNRKLSDWLFYQLIRKTAENISPKEKNYTRYTLYKWFLLTKCGYDATLSVSKNHILFYVKSDENIYGIPFYTKENNQYICLNYHDYGKIDFKNETMEEVKIDIPNAIKSFSYKINQLPDFQKNEYDNKTLSFNYQNKKYDFHIKLNPQIQQIFKNYPIVDFETYFNIPVSKETYSSLIPELKKQLNELTQQEGVDYIMNFTRHAFLYETDQINFGEEKRLSPEQTLLYKYSDCDDRASLFFYLIKEIYNLPMIAVLYPTHISMAVKFDKPIGNSIDYNGEKYSFCDPTPQKTELSLGEIGKKYKHLKYEIVYAYHPLK